MEIVKVSLSRTIPTGAYMNDKVGVEATLDMGESPEDALTKLSSMIMEWHKQANPHLYQEPQTVVEFSKPVVEVSKRDDNFEAEFNAVKNTLEEIVDRDKAALFLSKSNFRYHPDLKQIVESKKSKE